MVFSREGTSNGGQQVYLPLSTIKGRLVRVRRHFMTNASAEISERRVGVQAEKLHSKLPQTLTDNHDLREIAGIALLLEPVCIEIKAIGHNVAPIDHLKKCWPDFF